MGNTYKTYDPNVDYKKKMDEAVAAGDYAAAARYEQQRNDKINGEGLTQYQPTNQYGQYLHKNQASHTPYDPSGSVARAQQMLQNAMAQKPGAYQSTWQGQLDEMMGQILNRKPFEYDVNNDAMYQQLKDLYMEQGALAMEDTMGQAAALTGGYGNSYAQAVGQQAYQGYLNQLNDRVPELYQMALGRYQMEGQDMMDKYALMAAGEERDYGRYQDALSQYYAEVDRLQDRYNDERNWQYQLGRDQLSDQRYEQEWQYQLGRDQVADQRYDQQWQQSQADVQRNQAYELAMVMLQSGMMPSDEVLGASGISKEDAQKLFDKANTPVYSGGSGGGGGSDTDSGNDKDTASGGKPLNEEQWDKLNGIFQDCKEAGDMGEYEKALNALKWQGYDTSAFRNYVAESYGGGVNYDVLPPTDQNIMALGFGPISEYELMELVDQGIVGSTVKNGRVFLYLIEPGKGAPGNGAPGFARYY